ncbi:MAG: TonB-dependent receptor plug domain-containing protein [Cyanobacteria bacterium P01_D01_bin.56]
MSTTFRSWGGWSIGLWLLIGQGAIANPHSAKAASANVSPANLNLSETTDRLAQVARPVEITDIQIAETAAGFTLQLETNGELETPDTSISGNAVIADIPNAVLQLPDGAEFLVSNPADGIILVNATNGADNQVKIAITGTDAAPNLAISTAATGLLMSVTPGIPTAQTPEDDALRLVVTGAGEDGYFIPDASTATRTDTPLRDIPNSIQVIPRQIIEDQQAIRLEEVLENAAGVTFQGNNDGRGTLFSLRGFNNASVLRDGFIFNGDFTDTAGPEVANLERVEVLRGPASVLYGQVEPGGVINLVTKKPLSEPYYDFQIQAGNRGFISPIIDLSGPITDDGRLLYRLNTLYRREESFRDLNNDFERFFIAPTLAWQVGDRTDLTVSLEYVEDNEPYDSGTVAFGEGIADVPLDRVFSDPDGTVKQDFLRTGYTLEHRFSDDWQLRNQFLYTSSKLALGTVQIPFFINEETGDALRLLFAQDNDTDSYSFNTRAPRLIQK